MGEPVRTDRGLAHRAAVRKNYGQDGPHDKECVTKNLGKPQNLFIPNFIGKPQETAGRQSHGTKVCILMFSHYVGRVAI